MVHIAWMRCIGDIELQLSFQHNQQTISNLSLMNLLSRTKYINFSNRIFEIDPNRFYNLQTNRMVNTASNEYFVFPPVTGTAEQLAEFVILNDISIIDVVASDDLLSTVEQLIHTFNSHSTTNFEQILHTESNSLAPFDIFRVKGKGIVTDIIDADTVTIKMQLKLGDLCKPHYCMQNRKVVRKQRMLCLEQDHDVTVTIELPCRLFGIDAAEKETHKGYLIKQWLTQKLALTNNIVDVTILSGRIEKYGRYLAIIYDNAGQSINDQLLAVRTNSGQQLVHEYDGGTKQPFTETDSSDEPDTVAKPVAVVDVTIIDDMTSNNSTNSSNSSSDSFSYHSDVNSDDNSNQDNSDVEFKPPATDSKYHVEDQNLAKTGCCAVM